MADRHISERPQEFADFRVPLRDCIMLLGLPELKQQKDRRKCGTHEQVRVDVTAKPAGEPAPWSIFVERRSEGRDIDGIHFIQPEYKDHEKASVEMCIRDRSNPAPPPA